MWRCWLRWHVPSYVNQRVALQSLLYACSPGRLPSSGLRAMVQKLPDWVVCILHSQRNIMHEVPLASAKLWICAVEQQAVCRTSPEQLWMVKRSFCGPPAAFM